MGEYTKTHLIKELKTLTKNDTSFNFDNLGFNIRDSSGETLLSLVIRNMLWSKLSLEGRNLLIEESGVDYVYNGPHDKTKQRIIGDRYLHIAARAQDKDAFVSICKKNLALVTQKNHEGNNPFHEAVRFGILLSVVEIILKDIRSEYDRKISKAKNAEDWKESQKFERELRCKEKYIRDALRSKKCALNNDKKTPFDCSYVEIQERLKHVVVMEDSFICNKKLHLCLYIVGAIICITALCLSLYFLFQASPTFALSSIASMAVGGTTFLSLKTCNEVFKLSEDGTMWDVNVTQSDSVGLVVN